MHEKHIPAAKNRRRKGVLILKTMKKIIVLACVCCLALSFAGCGKLQISREIATVNGRVATKAEFMYYLENVKQQMLAESGTTDTESFWDAEIDGVKAGEAAKNRALEEMLRVEIACIKAEEKGLAASAEEIKQYRAMVKSTDSQQKAQIDAIQDATGLSDQQLIDLLAKTALANAFASDINVNNPESLAPTEEEVAAAYQKEYVRVKHILISNTKEEAAEAETTEGEATLTEEEKAEAVKAEKLALATEVLEKAKAGRNFDALIAEYGEDPGTEGSPEGYTFTKGEMVAEFEKASFALAVGEISDLVESSYGWHIIKKFALPTSGEDYDNATQTIKADLSQDKYNALVDSYKSEMTIEIHQNVVNGVKVK